jgi:inorganic pyrophosphatase
VQTCRFTSCPSAQSCSRWYFPQVLKVFGDNDPIDVVEIGSVALASGSVTAVKALGVLAMIDDGELDWKVVAIAASDPMASELHDVADVEAKMPGTISGIREWFRWYKVSLEAHADR